jgi:type II secretory pathway component GspD/PulD (secretin)
MNPVQRCSQPGWLSPAQKLTPIPTLHTAQKMAHPSLKLANLWLLTAVLCTLSCTAMVRAQDEADPAPGVVELGSPGELKFSFEQTPWRDVIKWLASESKLALHIRDLPTGSFSYTDTRSFTPDEAIDRINLFLLAQDYTLIRSDQLLTVINLSDARSLDQLDVLAKLVKVEDLAKLSDQSVVKCIFPLGEIKAESAVEELTALKLMTTPAVFSKTNRIMITDSVRKLKSVKIILDAFEPSTLGDGTIMKNFALEHVDAEDILTVARPHLGLATGEMIGIDVSISADLQGKNIFVTGVDDKVKLIEGLVTSLDKPPKTLSTAGGESVLKSHVIQGGNVETVYNVLQTLLATKDVRLSMDDKAGTIVALASSDIQKEIEETVAQLQVAEAEFVVIPLKSVDPYFAISLLEEMLDIADPFFPELEDEVDSDAPKIDADPGNMRLFVRGKKYQIERIRKIIAELDVVNAVGDEENKLRIFPVKGAQAIQLLETAAKFWREKNPIFLYPSSTTVREQTERVVAEEVVGEAKPKNDDLPNEDPNDQSTPAKQSDSPRVLAGQINSQEPIRCQVTPRGLMMQCDDPIVLDKFYEHLKTTAGPVETVASPPVVFYLKYTKSTDAVQILAELLDGGETAADGEAGTLVNGYVASPGSILLSSSVTNRRGATTMTSGTMTVVSDSRLNRLIAQGTASDMRLIENYLKIIDKDNSITSIETFGKSHLIELKNTKASEVAAVIREAFAGRITSSRPNGQPAAPQQGGQSQGQPQGQPQGQGQPQRAGEQTPRSTGDNNAPKQQGRDQRSTNPRGGGGQQARDLSPKLTVAVHEPSNSLIVTAPDQLFAEVEKLANWIDSRNEHTVRIIKSNNSTDVRARLHQILSSEPGVSIGSRSGRTPSSQGQSSPSPRPTNTGRGPNR